MHYTIHIPSFQVIDIGGEGGSEAWERQGWCGRGLRATDPRTPRTLYFDVPFSRYRHIKKHLDKYNKFCTYYSSIIGIQYYDYSKEKNWIFSTV